MIGTICEYCAADLSVDAGHWPECQSDDAKAPSAPVLSDEDRLRAAVTSFHGPGSKVEFVQHSPASWSCYVTSWSGLTFGRGPTREEAARDVLVIWQWDRTQPSKKSTIGSHGASTVPVAEVSAQAAMLEARAVEQMKSDEDRMHAEVTRVHGKDHSVSVREIRAGAWEATLLGQGGRLVANRIGESRAAVIDRMLRRLAEMPDRTGASDEEKLRAEATRVYGAGCTVAYDYITDGAWECSVRDFDGEHIKSILGETRAESTAFMLEEFAKLKIDSDAESVYGIGAGARETNAEDGWGCELYNRDHVLIEETSGHKTRGQAFEKMLEILAEARRLDAEVKRAYGAHCFPFRDDSGECCEYIVRSPSGPQAVAMLATAPTRELARQESLRYLAGKPRLAEIVPAAKHVRFAGAPAPAGTPTRTNFSDAQRGLIAKLSGSGWTPWDVTEKSTTDTPALHASVSAGAGKAMQWSAYHGEMAKKLALKEAVNSAAPPVVKTDVPANATIQPVEKRLREEVQARYGKSARVTQRPHGLGVQCTVEHAGGNAHGYGRTFEEAAGDLLARVFPDAAFAAAKNDEALARETASLAVERACGLGHLVIGAYAPLANGIFAACVLDPTRKVVWQSSLHPSQALAYREVTDHYGPLCVEKAALAESAKLATEVARVYGEGTRFDWDVNSSGFALQITGPTGIAAVFNERYKSRADGVAAELERLAGLSAKNGVTAAQEAAAREVNAAKEAALHFIGLVDGPGCTISIVHGEKYCAQVLGPSNDVRWNSDPCDSALGAYLATETYFRECRRALREAIGVNNAAPATVGEAMAMHTNVTLASGLVGSAGDNAVTYSNGTTSAAVPANTFVYADSTGNVGFATLAQMQEHARANTQPKEPTVTESKSTLRSTLEADAEAAAYRIAGSQFVKLAKEPLIALLSRHLGPDDESLRAKIAAFLDTELGTALLAGVLSGGVSALPAPAGSPAATYAPRLARELRVRGMSTVGDQLADVIMGPLREVAVTYLSALPTATVIDPAELNDGARVTTGEHATIGMRA